MTGAPALVLRADAGPGIGTGHVMRCLALAQGWREVGGQAVFVCAEIGGLARRIDEEGFRVERLEVEAGSPADAAATVEVARRLDAPVAVVDGYHLGAGYRRPLTKAGLEILRLDDTGDDVTHCRWVLNQNLHASADDYPQDGDGPSLLLGPRYALLRDEFLSRRDVDRRHPLRARRLLVTFGGADPKGGALWVLKALSESAQEHLDVSVVCGDLNPKLEELHAALAEAPFPANLRLGVRDMADLMLSCDLAVSSAGSTVWEMAFLRLPALLISTSRVEEALAEGVQEAGLFAYLGPLESLDASKLGTALSSWIEAPDLRRAAGVHGRELVDGDGRRRVVDALRAMLRP